MKISFHGACREVTGSCYFLEAKNYKFLVDCGIFQGENFVSDKNLDPFAFYPKTIDYVFLTHAHLDHCGRLAKLYKDGFRGEVYCTDATKELTELMLLDAARIMARESRQNWEKPLYEETDVLELMKLFKTLDYNKQLKIRPDLKIRLKDAGHILGSAIFEIWAEDKKLVFSGDLGNSPTPILNDTQLVSGADYVFIESTYAGRTHESREEGLALLHKAILDSIGKKGTLMIPIFALEKVQEILYELNYLAENKKIPYVPIFLDSPLSIEAVKIYKDYVRMYNKASQALVKSGDDLFNFPGLVYTRLSQESKKINTTEGPKVILAGSGMLNGGRMPYHLKFNLGHSQNHLLIISYQVPGSLGRSILDGAKSVMIDNLRIPVKAKVSAIGAFSSHADHNDLMHWLRAIKTPKPKKVFVMHGEEEGSFVLGHDIKKKLKINFEVPEYNQSYEL